MPSPFTATGPRTSAAATTAAPALAHTAPAGTGTPCDAEQPLARGLVEHGRASRPPARARRPAGAAGPAQARPIVAAASIAAIGDGGRREHRQPAPHPGGRPLAGQVRRHGRDQRPAGVRGRAGAGERVDGQHPVVVGAAVGPRQVGEEQVQVRGAAHHRGERRGHRVRVAPDVGVVVERVGQRHPLAEHRAQLARAARPSAPANRTAAPTAASAISAASPPELDSEVSRVSGSGPPQCSRHSAPSSASTESTWPIPLRRRNSAAAAASPASEAVCVMTAARACALRPEHQRDQPDPAVRGHAASRFPVAQVRERLDDHPDRRHPLRVQQGRGHRRHAEPGGVADGRRRRRAAARCRPSSR